MATTNDRPVLVVLAALTAKVDALTLAVTEIHRLERDTQMALLRVQQAITEVRALIAAPE